MEHRLIEVHHAPAAGGYATASREEPRAVLEPTLLAGVAISVADVLGQL